MKLFSKNPNAQKPTFWVESYNEKEKEFFLALGFTENPPMIPKEWRDSNNRGGETLTFKGSNIFGLFTEEEHDRIVHAIFKDLLPNRKRLTIHFDYEF